jgi:hypothetical protein
MMHFPYCTAKDSGCCSCNPTDQLSRIVSAIRSFNFGNYGLDMLDEIKDEEWLTDLATHVDETLES